MAVEPCTGTTMNKLWKYLFEIFEPSLQEKQAMDVLRRIPGNYRNWVHAMYLTKRRIPRQTMNRHYIVIHFKRPLETLRYDGTGSLQPMRVYRAVAFAIIDHTDGRKFLNILNWPTNMPFPRGSGVIEFSELRNTVANIEVMELPKNRIVQIVKDNEFEAKPEEEEEEDDYNDDDDELPVRERIRRRLVAKRLKKGEAALKAAGYTVVLAEISDKNTWGASLSRGKAWIRVGQWDSDVDYELWHYGGIDPDENYHKYYLLGYPSGNFAYWKLVQAQYEDEATDVAAEEWPEDFDDYNDDPHGVEYPIAQVTESPGFKLCKPTTGGNYEALDGTKISSSDVY